MYDPLISIGEFLFDVILVYFNIYYLLPKLLLKKKLLAYVLYTTISVLGLLIVNYYMATEWYEGEDFISINIQSATYTIGILCIAVAIKITKINFLARENILTLSKQKTESELKNLKDQVNPHFLFNNLNSLYVLSQTNPTEVSEYILQLSDLLRYQIYEAAEKKEIELKKEIAFIKNYINLEKIRRDNLKVDFSLTGKMKAQKITPFLLLPFIENAFKHSNNISENLAEIAVHLNIKEDDLFLDITNTIGDKPPSSNGGVGLKNIRKRLALLYPNRHKLSKTVLNGKYQVHLFIKLKRDDA